MSGARPIRNQIYEIAFVVTDSLNVDAVIRFPVDKLIFTVYRSLNSDVGSINGSNDARHAKFGLKAI